MSYLPNLLKTIIHLSDRNLYFKLIFPYKIHKKNSMLFILACFKREKRQLKKIAREKNCRTHQHVT